MLLDCYFKWLEVQRSEEAASVDKLAMELGWRDLGSFNAGDGEVKK